MHKAVQRVREIMRTPVYIIAFLLLSGNLFFGGVNTSPFHIFPFCSFAFFKELIDTRTTYTIVVPLQGIQYDVIADGLLRENDPFSRQVFRYLLIEYAKSRAENRAQLLARIESMMVSPISVYEIYAVESKPDREFSFGEKVMTLYEKHSRIRL